MKRMTFYIVCLLTLSFASCKKEGFDGLSDSTPAVAVTVSDLYGTYNYPVVATSVAAGGAISITLNIPANSGRTIKEITRVAAGTSGTNYKSVEGTTGLYVSTPIAGSGTSATFKTTLTEFNTKTGQTIPTAGTSTAFLNRYFFFLVTLDNGQTIIPTGVRVYVNK